MFETLARWLPPPWIDAMRAWLESATPWLAPLALISTLVFVASLIAVPWAVGRLPEDWLVTTAMAGSPATRHRRAHPSRWLLRNVAAAVLAAAGLLMLVLPGQGLLTLFVALIVCDLPFRDRALRWCVTKRIVLAAIDALRRARRAPPLRRPPPTATAPVPPQ
jgi:hypothetical protein